MKHQTILQFFEWYLPSDGSLWKEAAAKAKSLAQLGFTKVWLPPAYKGQAGSEDVGYGVYDLYDLGEFDQKGSIRTKYGTKEEYLAAIQALHKEGIEVLPDIVLNHKMGADATEEIEVQIDNSENRNQTISPPEKITAWTRFTFPGRNGTYSDFTWDASCFDGTDWDAKRKQKAVYGFVGKTWDDEVDSEKGNYDYLMGADVDMDNPAVAEELNRWGSWYLSVTQADGFRLDAVKHIRFSFFTQWLLRLRRESGRDLFAVGEYWKPELSSLTHYLDECGAVMSLFDVPLHFKFFALSSANGSFDLRTLFDDTLVRTRPDFAVTFVDNHDTQPGQALESWVAPWCKPIAYASILLREEGIPCVFYGDLYGIPHDHIAPVKELPALLSARQIFAYGPRIDYLDSPDVIGWTYCGDKEHAGSGCAVILTDGSENRKTMCVGAQFAHAVFVDLLGNRVEEIVIGDNGCAEFPVNGGSVSVWVLRSSLSQQQIPHELDTLDQGKENR